jgi:hypothetical protein
MAQLAFILVLLCPALALAQAPIDPTPQPPLPPEIPTEPQPVPEPPSYTPPTQKEAAVPGYRQHDGFFMRFLTGFGFANHSETGLTAKGGSLTGGIAAGGAVVENLILFGELFGSSTLDAKVDSDGAVPADYTVHLGGLGPGVSYYTPFNLYVSGTLALTRLNTAYIGGSERSKVGVGGNLTLGYEWWVSSNWGLGVAGRFYFSVNKADVDGAADPNIKTFGGGLFFSATMN